MTTTAISQSTAATVAETTTATAATVAATTNVAASVASTVAGAVPPAPTAGSTVSTSRTATAAAPTAPVQHPLTRVQLRHITVEVHREYKLQEARLTHMEWVLAGADLIPGLSVLSGFARTMMGLAMVVFYVGKAAINDLISLCRRDLTAQAQDRAYAYKQLTLALHGLTNILKGLSNIFLPVISNAYAIVNEIHLKQRFHYDTERELDGFTRLFDYSDILAAEAMRNAPAEEQEERERTRREEREGISQVRRERSERQEASLIESDAPAGLAGIGL